MEEHGISKIVSVKFHKVDEPTTSTATMPLDTPVARPVEAEEDAPHKREETFDMEKTE
jgi:hypothetical protein